MPADHDEKSNNEGDNDSDEPSITHLARPRPKAQVSFRLTRPDDDNRLSQSDPCTISSTADPPRNRRRLFRDMSYTNHAERRDYLPGDRRQFFSNHDTNNSSSTPSNGHDPRASSAPRRQDSFRGRHRMGDKERPGGVRARFKSYFEERARHFSHVNRNNDSSASCAISTHSLQQYRIPPPEEGNFSVLDAFFQLYSLAFGDVAMWVYGASFGKVLLFFLVLYMMFVYCFVVLLYLVDKHLTGSACINAPEEGELSARAQFEYAFELSWQTFTTVGYGNLGPPPEIGCYPIRLICSMEAILGMAFVSMCSGLFYAKLFKLLGRATVTFSSTLCVQYGEGLKAEKTGRFSYRTNFYAGVDAGNEAGGEEGGSTSRRPRTIQEDTFHPFPVIEFRIVNNRANHAPGKNEIWDAEVTAVVQLSMENDPHEDSEGLDEFRVNRSKRWLPPTASEINDENDNKSQKVFYKLALKPSFHPYFSRVWFVRHTLDATSPLLRREVRSMIRDRSSGWDPTLNNYQDIRECLVEFNSLQITMSGASALSRSEVFSEKTYTYEDVCVGWRYIAVCYEEDPGKKSWQKSVRSRRKHMGFGDDAATRVDLSLIHDIAPQRGNDFEPVESGDD
mmetsp:Transcript_22273/g.40014  ORF Transcript_22273/g.40014 Transcript_22273/m.40014 type:complete len:619 (+) Transcript_22273:141-1997(+)|eukprot:CAMPEP_0201878672 /NCGR_PEP_ID=MMETSP0902-20130614/9772_1 /ASSEMBLY_ACC=CAM_ASM_000551 /TAXON_ID=420261 /ORGANISM="Thalassiosira antarctica, Strain CCMP982" /LENGTH=618 /DNA_ID=CAMNT_0048406353 /DNA_START=117 /DNA_END=1973 /DNA_ORIENTATION=+